MIKYGAEKYFNVLTTAANVSVSHDEMKRPKSRGCWKYLLLHPTLVLLLLPSK